MQKTRQSKPASLVDVLNTRIKSQYFCRSEANNSEHQLTMSLEDDETQPLGLNDKLQTDDQERLGKQLEQFPGIFFPTEETEKSEEISSREYVEGRDIKESDTTHIVFYLSPKVGRLLPKANEILECVMNDHSKAQSVLEDSRLNGKKFCLIYENGRKKKFAHGTQWREQRLAVFEYPQDGKNLKKWMKDTLESRKKGSDPVSPIQNETGTISEQGSPSRFDTDDRLVDWSKISFIATGSKRQNTDASTASSSNTRVKHWHDHKAIRAGIENCASLSDFYAVFENPMFRDCLERLQRKLLVGKEPWEREEWAKQWAVKRAKDGTDDDDEDRRTLTRFLYALCNCCQEKHLFSEEDLVATFAHLIEDIIMVCLVMDRARALYGLFDKYHNRYGKAWYGKVHTEMMERIGAIQEGCVEEHALNKRYIWCVKLLKANVTMRPNFKLMEHWLTPTLCPLESIFDSYSEETLQRAKEEGIIILNEQRDKKMAALDE